MRVYTQVEYFSYMFSICALVATGWMLGYNDHQMLKYWYSFIMAILLIIRISDFKKKKYHHFFSEMGRPLQDIRRTFDVGQERTHGVSQDKIHTHRGSKVINNIALHDKASHQPCVQDGFFIQADTFVVFKKRKVGFRSR